MNLAVKMTAFTASSFKKVVRKVVWFSLT